MLLNSTQENNLMHILENWEANSHIIKTNNYMEVPSVKNITHLEVTFIVIDAKKLFDFVQKNIGYDRADYKDFNLIFDTWNNVDEFMLGFAIGKYGKGHLLENVGLKKIKMTVC